MSTGRGSEMGVIGVLSSQPSKRVPFGCSMAAAAGYHASVLAYRAGKNEDCN